MVILLVVVYIIAVKDHYIHPFPNTSTISEAAEQFFFFFFIIKKIKIIKKIIVTQIIYFGEVSEVN